jgi:predicted XRE-type DNA-binding protein
MAQRIVRGVDRRRSSGNVFADLQLPHADELKRRSALVIEVTAAIRCLVLIQHQAAERMGVSQAKVATLLNGDFTKFSERELTEFLERLGEIRPSNTAMLQPAA